MRIKLSKNTEHRLVKWMGKEGLLSASWDEIMNELLDEAGG